MKKPIKPLSKLDRIILEAGDRRVRSRDGREMSIIEGIVNKDVPAALQGNDQSTNRLLAHYARASERRAEFDAAEREAALWYKRTWSERFERAERQGLPPPDVLPHPAHVHVTNDGIMITGPMTAEERAEWEFTKAQMRHWSDMVALLRKALRGAHDDRLAFLLRKIRALIERLRRTIPPGWNWKETIYTRGASPEEVDRYTKQLLQGLDRASPEIRREVEAEVASWRIE